eukprot:366197-Chlamydomonas_euryale.AAC.9
MSDVEFLAARTSSDCVNASCQQMQQTGNVGPPLTVSKGPVFRAASGCSYRHTSLTYFFLAESPALVFGEYTMPSTSGHPDNKKCPEMGMHKAKWYPPPHSSDVRSDRGASAHAHALTLDAERRARLKHMARMLDGSVVEQLLSAEGLVGLGAVVGRPRSAMQL